MGAAWERHVRCESAFSVYASHPFLPTTNNKEIAKLLIFKLSTILIILMSKYRFSIYSLICSKGLS